jgi:damage-control phosphatase, subfamily I
MVSTDISVHERVIRDVLCWAGAMDLNQTPPAMAQRIHRRLREITGINDPYQWAKERLNNLALELIPALRAKIESANDPLMMAARVAIVGNVMDLGVNGNLTETEVRRAVNLALTGPFFGELDGFRRAIREAYSVLYLTDNADEIAFDRLLLEQIWSKRLTVAVRGAPVINDATIIDAQAVGLDKIVEVIDNGSDAPGTILNDCHPEFRQRFAEADLIIAKGQGNFETLSNEPGNIFFLFKVKCSVIASQIKQPVGTQVLTQYTSGCKSPVHEIGANL